MDKSVIERIQGPQAENHYNMTSSNHLYPAPAHNGAVPNIMDKVGNSHAATPYKMTPEGGSIFNISMRNDLVGHIHQSTPLNEIFFSDANVDKLQSDIQEQVSLMSGGKYRVDRQSDKELKIIMRSYYLMYSKNNASEISKELADLNSRVVGYAAGKVYSEVDFHMFYLKDIEDFAPPIANPMNPNVYGTRTGELKSFF
jgi:hypothetical protein